ncbi:phosphate ABC transporter permease subunit PstC [Paractinoplanes brasiliensis]|uniref:Phosphate transport system permease protein n=1 Tax=Paractinoplanes brasiliensis TaxID=52695 RepID=A0A4R6JYU8_9ACTN|nr:phosphate ABC transporter permease subunit PstC [Actinoplanes brasiliensis]TDO39965.1 phosphate ABC transporter membrane protein 1 (PhoT family) [Actinoplanes brasiliensis]GID25030.1 phosphate transport system permease protein [Actinoplanes brasiliensis]
MGDNPSRSENATAGDPGVTASHTRAAGIGVSPSRYDEPPIGGGGALPKKKSFSMESGFRGLSVTAGAMVLVIIVAIAVFLISKAVPALSANTENFLTYKQWFPNETNPAFGIAALAFGTVLTSIIALIVAVPISLGIALFLSHYAPKRLATPLGFTIDLLAAVPSVVFGLWGRDVFQQPVHDFSVWLNTYFGWIPIFGGEGPFGQSIMLGGLVLAIMVLPIVTSLSREVFQQTPAMNEEAALALGATRWEMIRTAVLPYGRPGVIAAVMLGLGRALGETIALALTLGLVFNISFNLIEIGGNSVAANIATTFGEANETGRGALIASGLVLFAITLIVNMGARAIIYRRREFRDSAA